MRKARILVVDDEQRYVWSIKVNLEARGYEVIVARDGEEAIERTVSDLPDLIVLDVRMPNVDGFEACKRIRCFSNVPIIMLTALAEDGQKIQGLELGADDYVTKPFNIGELVARVKAILRRVDFSERVDAASSFVSGDMRIDFLQKKAFIAGNEIRLTPTEYALLVELANYAERVLVPEYLLEKVWGVGYEGETGLLRQAIHRLRRKITDETKNLPQIETRVRVGYLLTLSE